MLQLVEFCLEAADAGKVVIVAALDGTFERKVREMLKRDTIVAISRMV